VLGVKTDNNVSHKRRMTVAKALEAAEIKPGEKVTITVNGKPADLKTKVNENDLIVVTPKLKDG